MRLIAAAVVLLASSSVMAEDSNIVGKYSGGVRAGGAQLVLNIQSVSEGKITGTAERYSAALRNTGGTHPCNGQYPIAGTLKDDAIDVRATERGGRAGDCGLRLRGTVQGNKIVAKWGNSDIELVK